MIIDVGRFLDNPLYLELLNVQGAKKYERNKFINS